MSDLTETQKAQEVADAYNAQKATIATDVATIQQLQAQIAAGKPVTADQLGALGIMDTLDSEVEADAAAAAAGSPAAGTAAPAADAPADAAPGTSPAPAGS